MLAFVEKSVAFVVCGAGLNNYCLPSITFCNSVAGGNVVFGTRVGNFAVKVAKKRRNANLGTAPCGGFLFC